MNGDTKYPFVSVIIPIRNEKNYIGKCLESIIKNNYPKEKLEVLVIDGLSEDGSDKIVKTFTNNYPFFRLLNNKKKITPAALNIGIQNATGEIIIRMDGHSTYESNFITECVNLLRNTDASNVGATLKSVGTNYISNAIAIAMSSHFGVGNSHFRTTKQEMWVDTVFPGAWYKETLKKVGSFNEELIANQDAEFNYRLRKMGGKILLSPKLKCTYFVRNSLISLVKQFFRNGYYKLKTFTIYPRSLKIRQLIPPLFVISLFVSVILIPYSIKGALIIPTIYFILNIYNSILNSKRKGWKYLPVLPLIFFIIHFAWGLGFWIGCIKFGFSKFSYKILINKDIQYKKE